MKKLILPICAMLMCMTSCQKDGNNILTLVMEEYNSEAKLHLDDGFSVWDNNDDIWFNGESRNVSVDNSRATISSVTGNGPFYAIFPYSWAESNTSITYQPEQVYDAQSNNQLIQAPMAGMCPEGESTLKFRNLGSILAVNVINNTGAVMSVKKIEVIADNDVKLCGTYNINYNDYSLTYSAAGSNMVSLFCGGLDIASGSNKMFYIALPPVEAKLTIKVYDEYDYYTKSQDNAHQMLRNNGYNADFAATTDIKKQYAPRPNQIMYTTTSGNALNRNWDNGSGHPIFYNMGITPDPDYNIDGNWFLTCDNTIETIPWDSFKNNQEITSVTLPNSVTLIEAFAFMNCQNLATVYLGSNIQSIRGAAFWCCYNLMNLYCPRLNTIDFEHNEELRISDIFTSLPSTATLHLSKEIENSGFNAWKEAWQYNGFNEDEWQEITIERPIVKDL